MNLEPTYSPVKKRGQETMYWPTIMDSITGIKTNVGKLQYSAGLAKAVALEYIRSINKHT